MAEPWSDEGLGVVANGRLLPHGERVPTIVLLQAPDPLRWETGIAAL